MDEFHLIALGLMVACLSVVAMIIRLVPNPEGPIDTSVARQSN